MGVYEARGQVTKGLKELLFRWTETKNQWNDQVSVRFEERFLTPLQMDLRNALGAMDGMATVLQLIDRDCQE